MPNPKPVKPIEPAAPHDAAPSAPSPAELASLLKYPVHHAEETKHYRSAAEGYEEMAADVAKNWAEVEADVKVPGLSRDTLVNALAQRALLLPIERKLQPFYERAYDNRREADSEGMGALLKLARTVKASGDAGLISRFQPLLDWVKAHHGGPRGGSPAGGGGGAPPGGGK